MQASKLLPESASDVQQRLNMLQLDVNKLMVQLSTSSLIPDESKEVVCQKVLTILQETLNAHNNYSSDSANRYRTSSPTSTTNSPAHNTSLNYLYANSDVNSGNKEKNGTAVTVPGSISTGYKGLGSSIVCGTNRILLPALGSNLQPTSSGIGINVNANYGAYNRMYWDNK
ncbi:hypothetical protein FOA43_003683 [Brettanomyces nanus]|uniref:Uncharacterized protein n=1 Tax=Eeniella nana TaxID=13502 RepID=A0A875RWG9_EENNA|nr:uncharacterized protein FOA43_003683 [Brettanomyces nanus]QPG76297.1 hypothetical protein FOA43_003683 [Brettanomyces nanus]